MSEIPIADIGHDLVVPIAGRRLADVPPELEWFANIDNKSTPRAYENALQDFMRFTGLKEACGTGY